VFGLWPSCAYKGCPWPAVCQLRNVKDGEEITVDLCPCHILDAQKAISEMEELRRIEAKTPDRSDLLLP
jgi:hypothetical protein